MFFNILAQTIPVIVGAVIALSGTWLNNRFTKKLSLIESKRIVYSKLLAASSSQFAYPEYNVAFMSRAEYDQKIAQWEKDRKILNGLAAEALLVSTSEELSTKLREFIGFLQTHERLGDIEKLLRNDLD